VDERLTDQAVGIALSERGFPATPSADHVAQFSSLPITIGASDRTVRQKER
jgi:hypothetical protein